MAEGAGKLELARLGMPRIEGIQYDVPAMNTVEIHLIPMDPVALTLKVEQKVALTGLAGLAR